MSVSARGLCAIVALLTALALSLANSANAASGAWSGTQIAQARLLTAVDGTGSLATIPAGVEVKLDDKWKTYWRSPGDAGLPPMLAWSGSSNLAAATLFYPAPERITVLNIQTFGYKHDVIFPIDVKLADPGKPLGLKLALDILVCAEQCIPKSFDLALNLPAGAPGLDLDSAHLIAKARAAVPSGSRTSGITVRQAQEVSDRGAPALEVTAVSDQPFAEPDVIPEVVPEAQLGAPRIWFSPNRREATFVLPLTRKLPVSTKLTGREVTLTVVDGDRALETKQRITQGASATEEEPGPAWLAMLGIALLGGLVLNLMPCVLPVLSLKFVAVASQGGRAPHTVRAEFLATAAGIIVSLLAIAGAIIALKAAGRTIGWGIQFQEPAFIAAMAVLVAMFACVLVGLFEVPLPRFIANAASKRTGPDEGLIGHFATGAFATLLATPCSAPFLGTAVGFALAGSALDVLAIFVALGIGLALPYLLIAAVPQLATWMPKPGRWTLVLKQAMAVPLAATAVWLLSILAMQVGRNAAIAIAFLIMAIIVLLFMRDRLNNAWRRIVFPVISIIALAAIILPDLIAAQTTIRGVSAHDAIAWKAFDRNQIRSLVSQGKTVFVDVTANWCLTCQANERFVLSASAVASRLNSQTISMQADWTRPDPKIGAYLASYGRYGIPFNVVYGPGAPGGIVLPELLTRADVDDALDRAGRTEASDSARGSQSAKFAATNADRRQQQGRHE